MTHWTEELFEKHPDLFLQMLEELVKDAECEVDLLLKYLGEQGFHPQKILDLNCGIGRHSIEFGRKDIDVLGTDLSRRYIEIAQDRAKREAVDARVSFKVTDMREIAAALSDEKPFDGVVNLYTSFGFYDDETNADILRQCRKLVRPEGFLVIELINRDWIVRNFQERGFSRHEGLIVLEDRYLDPKTSRMNSTWTFLVQKNGTDFVLERQVTLDHRVWSLHELIELFGETGWVFMGVYPGFGKLQSNVPAAEAHRFLLIGKNASTA